MLRASVFCLGFLLLAGPVHAQKKPPAPTALAERDRLVAGGRPVLIEVPQTEIGTQVDVGRVISDTAYGGGILGAIILSANDDKRKTLIAIDEEQARAKVAPLRQAIGDLDFSALAASSTNAALSRLDWFGARDTKVVKSLTEREAFAGLTGAPQIATVTYSFSLSPDFTQIKVLADIAIWQAPTKRSGKTPVKLAPLGRQRILAISELSKRSYEHAENVMQWSAHNGRIARASMTAAIVRLEQLIPYALGMSQSQIDALAAQKDDRVFAAGFYGSPIKAIPAVGDEKLLWSGGLISVVPARAVEPAPAP